MAAGTSSGALFRVLEPNQHGRVTSVELFFDLVFVYAVTQISHFLLSRFTLPGALETGLLFLAVWWVWVYTAWVTNWLDPEKTPVRLLLFGLMLAGLVLSMAMPRAFEDRGLWFASAYAAMQVGRTLFWVLVTPAPRREARANATRILCWLSASAVFWLLGAFAEGEQRLMLWGAAIAIEYASPSVRFWIPGLGASTLEDWTIEGGHMAERCAGFILIALGESIVMTGATFADIDWTAASVAAFVCAFVGCVAMWGIYFNRGAEAGSALISHSNESGRVARSAYTYLHMPIVAGIILTAVSDEIVLKHPLGHSDPNTVATTIGGPFVFLLGAILFKREIRGFLQLSHGVAMLALIGLGWFATELSPLVLSALTSALLAIVALWEALSLRSKPEPHASATSA
ncbi:low temperature requirement protein A [Bradyrhizobium ontarionense]|uniref:Low temperature requirement protein A n=1 Tax=Bradyrhizobium ontarionense TaxID=2898149 RepID=A0ABY3RB94_9BRAD|nr:low temperature requirement protein A [Bradyrhizobium sp. A19]UFZ04645.1 low temperature requirement protein A [Bradyrhizobium sp. A19]